MQAHRLIVKGLTTMGEMTKYGGCPRPFIVIRLIACKGRRVWICTVGYWLFNYIYDYFNYSIHFHSS